MDETENAQNKNKNGQHRSKNEQNRSKDGKKQKEKWKYVIDKDEKHVIIIFCPFLFHF